jgi:hypothetical protein
MSSFSPRDCEGFHRRDFLKIGAGGLFGLTLPDLLRLEAHAKGQHKAKGVIMVWLGGGPATIDMWDLKPDAPTGGDFKPIDTKASGIKISEHLPKVAQLMDKCALVRSVAHTIPDHGRGTVWMMTGNKPTPALEYPSLGSLASKLLPAEPGVPPYVTFSRGSRSGGAGYLGTAYNPFEVEGNPAGGTLRVRGISLPTGFTLTELEERNRLLEDIDGKFKDLEQSADTVAGLDKFHQQALDILRADKTKKAFNLASEPASVRSRYGTDGFGQGTLAARRLIEAGVRFVTVSLGGWDTHGNNFRTLKDRLLPQVDRVLSALVDDLAQKGLLDSTIVYCVGEFGRTPKINKGAGRDHWARSMAVFLAGGGIKPGYAHGTTDKHGMAPATDPCGPDDVAATLFHCLGIDGHGELMTATGRPINLFREGKVIEKLLA